MNKKDRKRILLIYAILLNASDNLKTVENCLDLTSNSWQVQSKFHEAQDLIEKAKDKLLNELKIEY